MIICYNTHHTIGIPEQGGNHLTTVHHLGPFALPLSLIAVAASFISFILPFGRHRLALLSDGRRFVSGSWDETARIVELAARGGGPPDGGGARRL